MQAFVVERFYEEYLSCNSHISTCKTGFLLQVSFHKLEALRERRPPWPRQIITPILPTVKMLSLGGERLPPPPPPPHPHPRQKRFGLLPAPLSGYATTIIVFFLLIYSS